MAIRSSHRRGTGSAVEVSPGGGTHVAPKKLRHPREGGDPFSREIAAMTAIRHG
jgi:hypothetical protein